MLSAAKHLVLSVAYEDEILRLSPQDDIATQSQRGGGGIFGKRAIHAGEANFDVALLEAQLDAASARAIAEGDFVRRRQEFSIRAFGRLWRSLCLHRQPTKKRPNCRRTPMPGQRTPAVFAVRLSRCFGCGPPKRLATGNFACCGPAMCSPPWHSGWIR